MAPTVPYILMPQTEPDSAHTTPTQRLAFPSHPTAPSTTSVTLSTLPAPTKSTRTLILDHLLWMHAEARCEEGWKQWGGEDDNIPGYEGKVPRRPGDVAAGHQRAKGARGKADGLEKVVRAMLVQPDQPFSAIVRASSPLASSRPSSSHGTATPPTNDAPPSPPLPDTVRRRLLLSLMLNTLLSPSTGAPSPSSQYPTSLSLLSSICPPSPPPTPRPSVPTPTSTSTSTTALPPFASFFSHPHATPPAGSIFSSVPRGAGPEAAWAFAGFSQEDREGDGEAPRPRVRRAFGRAKELYDEGCAPPPAASTSASSSTTSQPAAAAQAASTIGAGLLSFPSSSSRNPSLLPSATPPEVPHRLVDLIVPFLQLSALLAKSVADDARAKEAEAERRRLARGPGPRKEVESRLATPSDTPVDSDEEDAHAHPPRAPTLRPHFTPWPPSLLASKNPSRPAQGSPECDQLARPTRAWYALLAALLTQSALDGYRSHSWTGTHGVEVLLGLHAPPTPPSSRPGTPPRTSPRPSTDPDGLPELDNALRSLFPSEARPPGAKGKERRTSMSGWAGRGRDEEDAGSAADGREGRIAEFERQMGDRMNEFLTIPANTPTLRAHMDKLAEQYDLLAFERGMLRFLEDVGSWIGMAELAAHKPPPPRHASHVPHPPPQLSHPANPLSIAALLGPSSPSSTTSPSDPNAESTKPTKALGAKRWFTFRKPGAGVAKTGGKRARRVGSFSEGSGEDEEQREREKALGTAAGSGGVGVEWAEWAGPYGV